MSTEPGPSDALEPHSVAELVRAPLLPGAGEVAPLSELTERARSYARSSKAPNTLRAYESDLRHFGAWCEARDLQAFPAATETVALYLVDHAERLAVSTLRRRLAAISEAHYAARFSNPTVEPAVRITWAGIRRTHGKAPDAKEAAVTEIVTAMVTPLGDRLIDVRDRAILLIGFAGAFRRSELSALDVADVVESGEGLKIAVGRSKTDQEAEGHTVGITYGSNPPAHLSGAGVANVVGDISNRDRPELPAPVTRPCDARANRRRRNRSHGQTPS